MRIKYRNGFTITIMWGDDELGTNIIQKCFQKKNIIQKLMVFGKI